MVGGSLMLATALRLEIGGDKTSAIAHEENDKDLTLKDPAVKSAYIDKTRFDRILNPVEMVGHGVGES